MNLIASPEHRFATGAPIGCAALAEEVLVVREPGSGSREVVAQALAARGVEPLRTLEIGSTEAMKRAVAAGIGVAVVSAMAVEDQVALGRLKVVPLRDLHIERTLWQLRSPGRLDSPAAAAFERIIREPPATDQAQGTPAALTAVRAELAQRQRRGRSR